MQHLFRHKIVFVIFLCLSLSLNKIQGQTQNMILFDYAKWIHFGFCLGTNLANFKYQLSDTFYKMDTFQTIGIQKTPGITLGAIADLHMLEYFDIRVIPSLVLTTRTITYNFSHAKSVDKNIESIFFEVPLLLKFKSVRHGNIRFYVIGGGKFAYDFSSDANATRNPNTPIVALSPWNYYYEFGCGLDLYFELFKFSPEIKVSRGINNILSPYSDIYSSSFNKIFSNFIFFSFNFEG